ncbi:hypothetical protein VNO77_12785 [Canavalia gladiata]|uniref:Uncharacterized protein n=1 Tax=Canavalia gladiata TaxID=3824 RepID=A0AAN9LX42_CANGL
MIRLGKTGKERQQGKARKKRQQEEKKYSLPLYYYDSHSIGAHPSLSSFTAAPSYPNHTCLPLHSNHNPSFPFPSIYQIYFCHAAHEYLSLFFPL